MSQKNSTLPYFFTNIHPNLSSMLATKTLRLAIPLFLLSPIAQAVSVNVGGIILAPLQNSDGSSNLPDGSIIQVGYLLGIGNSGDLDTPAAIAAIDWNSFTPITGLGSPRDSGSYDTRVTSLFSPAGFFADGLAFDSDLDFGSPSGLPVRIALRVFDSTTATVGANYNTYTGVDDRFLLELPAPPDTSAGRADIDIDSAGQAGIVWEGTPFRTDLVIPEPSSSMALILGSLLLLGRSRRD